MSLFTLSYSSSSQSCPHCSIKSHISTSSPDYEEDDSEGYSLGGGMKASSALERLDSYLENIVL